MELWNQFVALVDGAKALSIVILILVWLATGMAAAWKRGDFNIGKVADWLKDGLLGMVIPYFAAGGLALVDESLEFAVPVAYGFIIATMASKVLANINELGLPLPLPDAIKAKLI